MNLCLFQRCLYVHSFPEWTPNAIKRIVIYLLAQLDLWLSSILCKSECEDGMKLIVQKVHIKSMFLGKIEMNLFGVAGTIWAAFNWFIYYFSFISHVVYRPCTFRIQQNTIYNMHFTCLFFRFSFYVLPVNGTILVLLCCLLLQHGRITVRNRKIKQ